MYLDAFVQKLKTVTGLNQNLNFFSLYDFIKHYPSSFEPFNSRKIFEIRFDEF